MKLSTSYPYEYDVGTLKKYNDNYYRVVIQRCVRVSGWEERTNRPNQRGKINNCKLENNISRAKNKIFEYAMCNDFEHFITLTIDKRKFDRYNLKKYYATFSQWLRNYSRKHNTKIDYIFVPELHQSGAWHLHGLIKGIPPAELCINRHGYLDWKAYAKKFGFVSIDNVRSKEGVSAYITKYISKDLNNTITELNAKMYYCSRGLKTAEVVKKGHISVPADIQPNFENDYVKIYNFNCNNISLLKYFVVE